MRFVSRVKRADQLVKKGIKEGTYPYEASRKVHQWRSLHNPLIYPRITCTNSTQLNRIIPIFVLTSWQLKNNFVVHVNGLNYNGSYHVVNVLITNGRFFFANPLRTIRFRYKRTFINRADYVLISFFLEV